MSTRCKRSGAILLALVVLLCGIYYWSGKAIDKGVEPHATGEYDYVIVLGTQVKHGCVPSRILRERLEVAATYLHEYPQVKAIVTGGQAGNEPCTEAYAMSKYLVNAGIDEARIMQEDKSSTTYENLVNSEQFLPQDTIGFTLISNDFHLLRAQYLAEKLGYTTDVVAAPTPRQDELKWRFRERLAFIKAFILHN